MSTFRRFSLLPILVTLLLATGCQNDPVSPGVGTGDMLETTINGTAVTFDLASGASRYDVQTLYATFGGTTAAPSRTLLVTFISDISSGSYPRPLSSPNANFTYIEKVGSDSTIYDCTNSPQACSLTLTASNGSIVDGTFSVNLTSRDGTRSVSLSNGRFSVKLR